MGWGERGRFEIPPAKNGSTMGGGTRTIPNLRKRQKEQGGNSTSQKRKRNFWWEAKGGGGGSYLRKGFGHNSSLRDLQFLKKREKLGDVEEKGWLAL